MLTAVALRKVRDRTRSRAHEEGGETLIELMVTVILLGLAISAVLSGLFTAVVSSDRHRRITRAGNELVSLSEAVYAEPYVRCGPSADPLAAYRAVYDTGGTVQPPTNYTFEVASVKFLADKTAATPAWNANCPTTDQGAQLVELWVTGTKYSNTEKLWIVKRDPS